MDFAIFAIAFNIGKMHQKEKNTSQNTKKSSIQIQFCVSAFFVARYNPNVDNLRRFINPIPKIAA